MISSVIARSTNRSPLAPAYREKSSGSPNRIRTGLILGISCPVGWISSVFSSATGTAGAQHPQQRVQGRLGRPAARTVHRDGSGAGEELPHQPALDPLAGEVFGF